MTPPATLLFILGLPRSGSTVLQHVLAANPGVASVGESFRTLNWLRSDGADPIDDIRTAIGQRDGRIGTGRCSCGAFFKDCPVWTDPSFRSSGASQAQRYRTLLDRTLATGATTIIDSSKTIETLHWIVGLGDPLTDIKLKVVFMHRDFRGWVISYRKHAAIRDAVGRSFPLTRTYLADAHRWGHVNRRYLREVRAMGLPLLHLSLEQLVFRTDLTMRRLQHFVGGGGDLRCLDAVDLTRTHEMFGSGSLKNRAGGLTYDDRWAADKTPMWLGPLLYYPHRVLAEMNRLAQGTDDDTQILQSSTIGLEGPN